MGVLDFMRREKRSIENPTFPVSSENFLSYFGMGGAGVSASGVTVNIENALGVPSVWAACNFIPSTFAGLPLNLYRRTGDGRKKIGGKLSEILHDAVNDDGVSSFQWRKHMLEQVLTGGRAFTFIERNQAGAVVNLWPLDPNGMTIKRENMRKVYEYRDGSSKSRYEAMEIIDIPFMLKADGVGHRGPIMANRDTIGLAIAATNYGSKFFQNGGVPPFAITGNFLSPKALKAAADDLHEAVRKAAKEERQALTLPAGLEIKAIGSDPEKAQLVELKRFIIEEIARIYSIPPTFLQDLTHGTFSNTEQQDLHFVKHTMKRWVEQFEQELNLKIFGRGKNTKFAELNMDGLLRGDFKTRMEGYAQAIQNAVLKPNEARRMENREDDPEGNVLLVQGATVPLGSQPLPAEPTGDDQDG